MKRLIVALAMLTLANTALATTYHIDPYNGNDNNNASSRSQAWQTMGKANLTGSIAAGDTVICWPGVYSSLPNPAASSGGRFTYLGRTGGGVDPVTDSTACDSISFPTGTLSHSYLTIKGVRFGGTVTLSETADFDSIISVRSAGRFVSEGADYTTIVNSLFYGSAFRLNRSNLGHSDGMSFYGNTFRNLGGNSYNQGEHVFVTSDCDSTTWYFNKFYVKVPSTLGDGSYCGVWHFDETNSRYRGNHLWVNIERGSGSYNEWRWRSDTGKDTTEVFPGCHDNTFDCDTVIYYGNETELDPSSSSTCDSTSPNVQVRAAPPANDGKPNPCWSGTPGGLGQSPACIQRKYPGCIGHWAVTMDSCLIDATGCTSSRFYFAGAFRYWTITNTTIAMHGTALESFDTNFGTTVDHCTLAGKATGGNEDGVVQFTDQYNRPAMQASALIFTNNIVYNFQNLPLVQDYGVWWQTTKMDSSGQMHGQNKVASNNNLIWNAYADSAIGLKYTGAAAVESSVGDSIGPTNPGRAENRYRIDSLSVHGSPRFGQGGPDSTLTSFDARIGLASAAIGRASDSMDIGAWQLHPAIEASQPHQP